MKKALIIQHMDHDHPGRFLDYFAEDHIIPEFVRVFEGQDIPPLAPYDLMFVLGGSQDTWQEEQHPHLTMEKAAIREWVWDRAKPYLGVCLGHQLLATALGGQVATADVGEVGVFDVALNEDGMRHAFFDGVAPQQTVMQWHHAEVKRVPQSAKVLAASANCAVQTLAIENHALSVADRHLQRQHLLAALDHDFDLVARLFPLEDNRQIVGVADAALIELHDHVAGFEAGLGGG